MYVSPNTCYVCRIVCKLVRMWPRSCLIADNDGNLPLHVACRKGYLRIARVLMHSMYGSGKYERNIRKLKMKQSKSRDDGSLSEKLEALKEQMRKRKEKETNLLLMSMNTRYSHYRCFR